jgi:hypothetical protein
VILTARVYASGTRIDYDYDTITNEHRIWHAGRSAFSAIGKESVLLNLEPYMDNHEVKKLAEWVKSC